MLKRIILNLAAVALTFGGTAQAGAGVLLDLEDPPGQTDTPLTLQFNAGSTSTTITFAGYQLSSALEATNIDLTLGPSGPNLLGGDWTFTPAQFGSFRQQIQQLEGEITAITASVSTGSEQPGPSCQTLCASKAPTGVGYFRDPSLSSVESPSTGRADAL